MREEGISKMKFKLEKRLSQKNVRDKRSKRKSKVKKKKRRRKKKRKEKKD